MAELALVGLRVELPFGTELALGAVRAEGKGILVEATGEVPGTHGTIELTEILESFRSYFVTYF